MKSTISGFHWYELLAFKNYKCLYINKAFSREFTRNSGFILWLQQIRSLWTKRFWIFFRRYVLAIVILLLPMLMEGILAGIIPSSSTLINSIRGIVSNSGSYELSMTDYGKNTLPYTLNGNVNTTKLQNYVTDLYVSSNRPGITLSPLSSDVNDYVLAQRKSNLQNIYSNYYYGMSLNLTGPTQLNVIGYYNSMAFHSSANILNEIDNLILVVANNYSTDTRISTINSPLSSDFLSNATNFLEILACVDSLPVTLLNFINAVIVAFIISFTVIHVARERTNGSKQLQQLSGIHYVTYWISNYLFDMLVMLFQISMLVIMLKIVDAIKTDPTNEVHAIAGDNTLGYVFLLFLFSCFSWCTLAYLWSFLFKTDIMGFVILVIILGFIAFLDIILVFVELLLVSSNNNKSNGLSNLVHGIRLIFALVLPNITIKRGMYNLKILKNSFCISNANTVLAGKLVTKISLFYVILPLKDAY